MKKWTIPKVSKGAVEENALSTLLCLNCLEDPVKSYTLTECYTIVSFAGVEGHATEQDTNMTLRRQERIDQRRRPIF
jgi:hypothetical protein